MLLKSLQALQLLSLLLLRFTGVSEQVNTATLLSTKQGGGSRRALEYTCPKSCSKPGEEQDDGGVEVIFWYPRDVEGFIVAYCSSYQKKCGRKAAHLFCEEKGFDEASSWEIFPQAGLVCGPTRYMDDPQRICSGKMCPGFTRITCHQDPQDGK